jgi:hypothetical protein
VKRSPSALVAKIYSPLPGMQPDEIDAIPLFVASRCDEDRWSAITVSSPSPGFLTLRI